MPNNIYDVVIIGAGIAGMSCSLYLKRNNLNILLIENKTPGGQINYTSMIENYPGFTKIDGVSFNMNVLEQLKLLDIIPKYYDIKEIKRSKSYKKIITTKEEILCKNIVIATGRSPKKLGLENEDKFIGKGISWCSFCDGNLYKDKEVIVIGGGSSSLEEALYLSNICSKVTIINKNDYFKSDKVLLDKVLNNKKITIMYEANITNYIDDGSKIIGIKVIQNNIECEIDASCVFIYIGYKPNSAIIESMKVKLVDDYIVTNNKGETNIKGIYACGDVVKQDFYQIILAASSGVNVALNIIKKLA